MVKQVVTIPDKDLFLLLELAKKFKWKVSNDKNRSSFQLSDEQLKILEISSKTPLEDCFTVEEVFKDLDNV